LEDYLLDANLRFYRASLRQEDALYSVQPFGVNFLGHGRNITTSALAKMFPFARRLQADATGIPYGIDRTTGAWVIVNDFTLPNSNLLIVGEQGSGKSMFLKYKATWAVLLGMRCYILDLEGEFEPMCRALNGMYLDMALTSAHHMNILDLNPEDPDAWLNGMQDTLAWLDIALGSLTHKERNVILIPTYERIMKEAGIQPDDPVTWRMKPPVLRDLYGALRSDERRDAQDLADRLQTLADGVYANAFSQLTNVNTRSPLVVFGEERARRHAGAPYAPGSHLHLGERIVENAATVVWVDEAWRWLEHPRHDLAEMARFRKRNAGVHLATQHGGDLSASQQAVVIRDTAALTMLFRQTAASVPTVASLFGLNEVEARELLTLDRGESVLLMGANHVPLYTVIRPIGIHYGRPIHEIVQLKQGTIRSVMSLKTLLGISGCGRRHNLDLCDRSDGVARDAHTADAVRARASLAVDARHPAANEATSTSRCNASPSSPEMVNGASCVRIKRRPRRALERRSRSGLRSQRKRTGAGWSTAARLLGWR
jgi:hypothetical protein